MEPTPPTSRPPAARPPAGKPPGIGWPLKSLDRQDLRWLLVALTALVLGSAVMLIRGRILSDDPAPSGTNEPPEPPPPNIGQPR